MSSSCKHCGNLLNEAQMKGRYKSCPSCSANDGNEHIFYSCPEAFGESDERITPKNPAGFQSHCTNCRGLKMGPHSGYKKCSEL